MVPVFTVKVEKSSNTRILLFEVDYAIPPFRLKEVDDGNPIFELVFAVATKGHWWEIDLLGEKLDPILKVDTLVHADIADDDKRLSLVDKLLDHSWHVYLGILPRKIVEC